MRRSVDVDPEDPDVVIPPEELIIVAAGYGRWQLLVTVIMCLSIIIHAMNSSLEPIEHMTGWWCEKPSILRSWTTPQWITFSHVNATRKDLTTTVTNERFKGCYVYKFNFSRLAGVPYDQRPRLDRREIVLCEKVHYSQKFGRTTAEKFDLGCDPDFEHSVWHAFTIVGKVLGYVTFGCLSDRVGRRAIFFVASFATPFTALALAFAPSYGFSVFAQTLHSFFHGAFLVSIAMALELSDNAWRTRVAALASLAYGLGVGLTPVLFRAVGSLDALTLMVNIPSAVFLLTFGIVPESPPWLFCTRKSAELSRVIKIAAKTNDAPLLADNFRVVYVDYTDAEKLLPKGRPGFWKLLQEPEVACEMIAIGYLVTLSALIEGSAQGRLINNEKRIHRWYLIVGLITMAGVTFSQFCVLLIGHRKLLHVAVFLILLSTATTMVNLREDYLTTTGPATTLLAANIFAVSLSHGALMNYSARTVPTLLRGTYLGLWSAIRVSFTWAGNHRYLNYLGISSVAVITILIAALATLNISDLRGRELPDTVNDAVNFKEKPKPKRWLFSEAQISAGHY